MSPNAGGGGGGRGIAGGGKGGLRGLSQLVHLYTGAQINFGDLTPYFIYGGFIMHDVDMLMTCVGDILTSLKSRVDSTHIDTVLLIRARKDERKIEYMLKLEVKLLSFDLKCVNK
jgi:hypothetical protein